MTLKVIKVDIAASKLSDLILEVAAGSPVAIVAEDGIEAVMVSKTYFEKAEHLLKSPLLSSGFAAPGESDLDRALKDVRHTPKSPGTRGSDAGD